LFDPDSVPEDEEIDFDADNVLSSTQLCNAINEGDVDDVAGADSEVNKTSEVGGKRRNSSSNVGSANVSPSVSPILRLTENQNPDRSRSDPIPGTSRSEPIPGTSRSEPIPGTSRSEPIPGTSRGRQEVAAHILRRNAASALLENNVNPEVMSRIL